MTTVAAGSSATLTATVKGALFILSAPGGCQGSVTGAVSDTIGPTGKVQAYGPLDIGQSITVSMQLGTVLIEFGDADPHVSGVNGFTVTTSSGTQAGPDGGAVSGGGIPSAFTSRALTSADNGATLVAAGAAAATVNTGLPSGFGCTFVGAGAVTFAGTATVTDYRTTGAANPSCALIQIGTDAYGVYGSKA